MIKRQFAGVRRASKKSIIILLLVFSMLAVFIPANSVFPRKPDKAAESGLVLHKTGGVVRLATGDFANAPLKGESDLTNVMRALSDTYGVKDAGREFDYVKTLETPFGYTHKLAQRYRGYPVYGRSVNVSADRDGNVLAVSGNYLKNAAPRNRIKKSAQEAVQIVEGLYPGAVIFSDSLVIYSLEGTKPVFAYNVSTSENGGTSFFVDAQTGGIIKAISTAATETIPTEPYVTRQKDYYGNDAEVILEKTVDEGEDGHTYYLADCLRNIYLIDAQNNYGLTGDDYQNKTGIFGDKIAISAFLNFVKAFDFYADAANIGVSLRGIDGSVDLIHDNADTADEIMAVAYLHYGAEYENAGYVSGLKEEYPKEAVFIFGDGRPERLFDLAVGRDVVGHEYHHAVTAYSADLIYLNAAGAINEAYSDIFGALIEGYGLNDERFWLCGEEITSPSYKKALRDMKDPRSLSYPDYYKGTDFYPFCYRNHDHSGCDNGGVHYNSSVITHAAYEMYNLKPELFTKELMGELWYTALLMLPQDAEFEDLRIIMRQAALALGCGEDIINTIGLCFDHVGIFGTEGLHTITFNKGAMTGDEPASISRYYGETFTIPECDLAQAGYEHIGWSADGTVNEKIYYPKQTYKMPGRDLTLYPVKAIGMWNGLEPAVWQGQGSLGDPYLINSERDLATLAYYVNNRKTISPPQPFGWKYFKLTKDLDLKNIPWIPIGLDGTTDLINGPNIEFYGNGHKIYNLTITRRALLDEFKAQGLFGYVQCNVYDLGIESGNIYTSANYVGAIAGELYGSIKNCYSKINVENTFSFSGPYIINKTGGLAGQIYHELENSYNTGGVTGKGTVGGLAGTIETTIINCYNTGDITGGGAAGGIFGTKDYPWWLFGETVDDEIIWRFGILKVANSYNTGKVTGQNAGGIGGMTTDTYYANCINTGAISGVSPDSNIGGIAGYLNFNVTHNYYDPVEAVNESSVIMGCKNTGLIDASSAGCAGGIVGRMFDNKVTGYVFYENNLYKSQVGLTDIGNYYEFGAKQVAMFKGAPARVSSDNVYSGDFAFGDAGYYRDKDNWAVTGWSTLFGAGYDWQIRTPGSMPVHKQPEYWMDYHAESFAGGSGTETDPYQIATAEQLALLAYIANVKEGYYKGIYTNYNYFALVNDIDLAGRIWISIDRSPNWNWYNFSFDGKGHTVKNMYARDYTRKYESPYLGIVTQTAYAGLFGSFSGTIKNIIIEGCDVFSAHTAGAIAAYMRLDFYPSENLISNCEVRSGTVAGGDCAGGIVGNFSIWTDPQSFTNLANNAAVAGNSVAGGIFGLIITGRSAIEGRGGAKVTLEACVNTGGITVFGMNRGVGGALYSGQHAGFGGSAAGGLIGAVSIKETRIKNCINNADIKNLDFFGHSGGFIGFFDASSYEDECRLNISYCVSHGDIAGLPSRFSSQGAVLGSDYIFKYYNKSGIHNYEDWSKHKFYIDINNVHYRSNTVAAFPAVLSGYEFVNITCADTYHSDAPEDFAFADIEYFFSPWYFDAGRQTANQLYYYFNGGYKRSTVKFLDWDGAELTVQSVLYKDAATAPASIPSRQPTASEIFTFTGWDNDFDEVTHDLAVTALYSSSVRLYTVRFMNGDGTVGTQWVAYGSAAVPPERIPSKVSTAQYHYEFSGWDKEFDNITGDLTVYAVFEPELRSYTVTFKDGDMAVSVQSLEYGGNVVMPENPVKNGYTFIGWFKNEGLTLEYSGGIVYGDLVLYAKFENKLFPPAGGPDFSLGSFFFWFTVCILFLASISLSIIAFRLKKSKKGS